MVCARDPIHLRSHTSSHSIAREDVLYFASNTHFVQVVVALLSELALTYIRHESKVPIGVKGIAANISDEFQGAIESFVSTPSIQHLKHEIYYVKIIINNCNMNKRFHRCIINSKKNCWRNVSEAKRSIWPFNFALHKHFTNNINENYLILPLKSLFLLVY